METSPPVNDDTLFAKPRNRREFFQLCGQGAGYGALAGLLPACGSSTDSVDDGASEPEVQNREIPAASAEYIALKRTSFGPRWDELRSMRKIGIQAYLEQQLDHLALDDSELEAEIALRFPVSLQPPYVLLPGFPDNAFELATQMVAATQYRQAFSKRQLFEVMVEFWTDHFNIQLVNGLNPTLKPVDDQQVIRQHALGNFRDLLHASAKSPAMLFYLDNFFNQVVAPNENYARELMELHTLGVDGGYDEDDVKEVARCFTGWSLRFPGDPEGAFGEFNFVGNIHDYQAKQVLGMSIAAGGGITDGEQVLDMLAAHPSTAEFIATKLCRRFISDDPPQHLVSVVATAFGNSGGDIKTTLRALFASPEFVGNPDSKFTRPSEFMAGMVRALAPDTPYPTDNGQMWFAASNVLGHLPFYWPTPDGYPDRKDYWANTGGFLNRWRLAFFSLGGVNPGVDIVKIKYNKLLGNADTVEKVVDKLVKKVLMRPLDKSDRRIIIRWFKQELDVKADTRLPKSLVKQIAALTAAALMSSAYFQLR